MQEIVKGETNYDRVFRKLIDKKGVELNPYEVSQETKIQQPRVHEIFKKLCSEGYIEPEKSRISKTNVKKTYYHFTFKGVLRYLSGLYKRNIVKGKKYSSNDKNLFEKLDKLNKSFLEEQGNSLKYPLFQHYRYLEEKIQPFAGSLRLGIEGLFWSNAEYVLNPEINKKGTLLDNTSKMMGLSLEFIIFQRKEENDILRDEFGLNILQAVTKLIRRYEKPGDSSSKLSYRFDNKPLREYVSFLLNKKTAEYEKSLSSLRNTATLFSIE